MPVISQPVRPPSCQVGTGCRRPFICLPSIAPDLPSRLQRHQRPGTVCVNSLGPNHIEMGFREGGLVPGLRLLRHACLRSRRLGHRAAGPPDVLRPISLQTGQATGPAGPCGAADRQAGHGASAAPPLHCVLTAGRWGH